MMRETKMKLTIVGTTVGALVMFAALAAHAEPKTITIDGCATVAQEMRKDNDRTTITVKCTGESFEPKVRADGFSAVGAMQWNNGMIGVGVPSSITGGNVCTSIPPKSC